MTPKSLTPFLFCVTDIFMTTLQIFQKSQQLPSYIVRGRNRGISGDLPKLYKWNFIADLCSIDLRHEFKKCCQLGNPGQIAFLGVISGKTITAKKSNLPRVAKLATFLKSMSEVYRTQISNKIPLIQFGQVELLTPGLYKQQRNRLVVYGVFADFERTSFAQKNIFSYRILRHCTPPYPLTSLSRRRLSFQLVINYLIFRFCTNMLIIS